MSQIYEIHDAHRPVLAPGSYTVSASWKVVIGGDLKDHASETTSFQIGGERIALQPADLLSVYPPEESRGVYANILPHCVLSRDTLPWERSAKSSATGPSAEPWLALLLLSEEEAAASRPRTVTLAQYRSSVSLSANPGQDSADSVQVIELPAGTIRAALPTLEELRLLGHVRVTTDPAGKPTASVAVVVGKRRPSPAGRYTAHLVALEGRYPQLEERYFGLAWQSQPPTLFVSLKSWSFQSEAGNALQTESLDSYFQGLDAGWLQLPARNRTLPSNYPDLGFVALQHRFRTGESAVSWYAGPLTSLRPSNLAVEGLLKLPAQSADELLWYDEDLRMLNVSFASAWELGRLLAMQNRRIFMSLTLWRRQQIHCAHAAKAAAPDSPNCTLPQIQCACSPAPAPPVELVNWIDGLRKLQGIPYRYLIPDEKLLPPESIRFFALDSNFLDALLDGVLSAIRAPSLCPEQLRSAELALLAAQSPGPVTGFLLRSAAVSGWPGLEVQAFGRGNIRLEVFRGAQLSPTILLYMFKGVAESIAIEQCPDTVHLSVPSGAGRIPDPARFPTSAQFANAFIERPETLKVSVSW